MNEQEIIKMLEETSANLKKLDDLLPKAGVWLEYECKECGDISSTSFKMFDIAFEINRIKDRVIKEGKEYFN